jgi:hypothetical protein
VVSSRDGLRRANSPEIGISASLRTLSSTGISPECRELLELWSLLARLDRAVRWKKLLPLPLKPRSRSRNSREPLLLSADRVDGWRDRFGVSHMVSHWGRPSIAALGDEAGGVPRPPGRSRYDPRFICLLSCRSLSGEGGPSTAGSSRWSISGVGRLLDTGLVLLLPRDKGMERVDLMASRLSVRLRPVRKLVKLSEESDMTISVWRKVSVVLDFQLRARSEGDELTCPLLSTKDPGCESAERARNDRCEVTCCPASDYTSRGRQA